jgi:hypothetical protein
MVRTTQDSDVVAELRPEHIHDFVSALQGEFHIDEEMIVDAIQHNSSFNIIHRETMFKVDVFVPHHRPFLQSQLARAQMQTFSFETEVSGRFASPEDTVLSKLEWYRMGGEVSDRQWRDILGVLKTRAGELELDYMRKWAEELKVMDLLERALKEALPSLLEKAIASRVPLLDSRHESAFRLFNGFYEGYPDLALDVYGRTLRRP